MGNWVLKLGCAALWIAGFAGCVGTTYKHRDAAARDGAADARVDARDATAVDARDATAVDTRPADTRQLDARDADPGDMARVDTRPSAEALLIRGEYLVKHVSACADCHTPALPSGMRDTSKYLAGNADFLVRADGARLPSRNLTPHASGLDARGADEIKRMLLDGKRTIASGDEVLNPLMPYYVFHNMTSDDADAIVAYLRAIPAVDNTLPARAAAFDVSEPADPLDMAKIPAPSGGTQKESAVRGRYLATQTGLCIACHTMRSSESRQPLDVDRFFQGGEDYSTWVTAFDIHPTAANLTSDAETGLGNWSVNDIVTGLKTGKDKDGHGVCLPMPVGPDGAYGGLTQSDATDIANYIKSLPAASNEVPGTCTWPPASPATTETSGL